MLFTRTFSQYLQSSRLVYLSTMVSTFCRCSRKSLLQTLKYAPNSLLVFLFLTRELALPCFISNFTAMIRAWSSSSITWLLLSVATFTALKCLTHCHVTSFSIFTHRMCCEFSVDEWLSIPQRTMS